jgi:hypothetical protein
VNWFYGRKGSGFGGQLHHHRVNTYKNNVLRWSLSEIGYRPYPVLIFMAFDRCAFYGYFHIKTSNFIAVSKSISSFGRMSVVLISPTSKLCF